MLHKSQLVVIATKVACASEKYVEDAYQDYASS